MFASDKRGVVRAAMRRSVIAVLFAALLSVGARNVPAAIAAGESLGVVVSNVSDTAAIATVCVTAGDALPATVVGTLSLSGGGIERDATWFGPSDEGPSTVLLGGPSCPENFFVIAIEGLTPSTQYTLTVDLAMTPMRFDDDAWDFVADDTRSTVDVSSTVSLTTAVATPADSSSGGGGGGGSSTDGAGGSGTSPGSDASPGPGSPRPADAPPTADVIVLANPAGLSSTRLAAMSPTEVARIDPASFALLPAATLAVLNARQAAALTSAQVARLTPARLAALKRVAVEALRPSVLASVRPQSLAALAPATIRSLSSRQLQALTPRQIAELTAEQLRALSPGQRALLRR